MNRYTRDQICGFALDMAQLPNLDAKDRPSGTIVAGAFTPQWLQDVIDFWFHMVPFSATVKTATGTISANADHIVLPSDFVLDVRNGLTVQTIQGDSLTYKRTVRVPLQKWINRNLASQKTTDVKYPTYYTVWGDDALTSTQYQFMYLAPIPTITVPYKLYYYALPAVLTGSQKPKVPNDYVCIEYVRIRALEWARVYDVGTAQRFCDKIVGGMKAAGLMNEPEDDEIPFNDLVYRRRDSATLLSQSTYAWMGNQ